MRAAVAKIPHLLYEEDLLKPRKWYMIFIYKIWFMYNDMMGMGEKTPKKYIYMKNKEKIPPFGFPPIPPSIKLGADCFPGRKNRKQAGHTLGGARILIYRDKRNKGSGVVWVDRSR